MTSVAWTKLALRDLEEILAYVGRESEQGAATIVAKVEQAAQAISKLPRASRRDPETGHYGVVPGLRLLLVYELVEASDGLKRAEIHALFHTSRSPDAKPGREQTS